MRDQRPSTTALLVALGLSCVASDPRLHTVAAPLHPGMARRWVAERSAASRYLAKATTTAWGRWLARRLERLLVPGITLHYAVRKRFIDDVVRDALDGGFRQVIILGAGFDTLAFRLHGTHSDTRFIEIDHPATQAVKRREIEKRGGLPANVVLAAADLSKQSLADVLRHPAIQRDAPTLVVAEGLLMYLTAKDVAHLFGTLVGMETSRLRFVFTTMNVRKDGRIRFQDEGWLLSRLLTLVGEPFRWGLRREEIGAVLACHGSSLLGAADADHLRRRYLSPVGLNGCHLAQGELIVLADRDHNSGSAISLDG